MLSAARLHGSVIKRTPQTLDPSFIKHAWNNGIAVSIQCLIDRTYGWRGLVEPAVHWRMISSLPSRNQDALAIERIPTPVAVYFAPLDSGSGS